jgi:hypothetical protein
LRIANLYTKGQVDKEHVLTQKRNTLSRFVISKINTGSSSWVYSDFPKLPGQIYKRPMPASLLGNIFTELFRYAFCFSAITDFLQ